MCQGNLIILNHCIRVYLFN